MRLTFLSFVCSGVSLVTIALAQPDLRKCDSPQMGELTACLARNTCFDCLSGPSFDVSGNSDPANSICDSYVCPVLRDQSCCPLCESEATAMKTCVVEVIAEQVGGSKSVCSCGAGSGENDIEPEMPVPPEPEGPINPPEGSSPEPEQEQPETEEPVVPEAQEPQPEEPETENPTQSETPDAPGDLADPCTSASEQYDQCVLETGGSECLPCAGIGADLAAVTTGNGNCQSLLGKVCSASSCCCATELKLMAQCALKEAGSTCHCDDQTKPELEKSDDLGPPEESPEPEPEQPDAEASPESEAKPKAPDTPNEPANCTGSAEKYYACVLEGGTECLSCEAIITNLASVTTGVEDCDSLKQQICAAATQCCCGDELRLAAQCALRELTPTCNVDICDGITPLEDLPAENPDDSEPGDSSEAGPGEPTEPSEPEDPGSVDPCTESAKDYDQCVLDGGPACLSCVAVITDITAIGLSDCQSLNEKIQSAGQCCCGPELEQMARCSLQEVGSTCQVGSDDGETPEEPAPENPGDESMPREPEPDTCPDLAVAYEQCLSKEACFSCVDEAVAISPRSFGAAPASCQAVRDAACPAAACCCSTELQALTECSHLEEHGVVCIVDCDGYNATAGEDDSDTLGEPDNPPVKCADAAALYELCADTSECSSCQTVDTIARASLAAIGEGRSGYSCDTINGMVCPAMACCCERELQELAECTLEAHFETCRVNCQGDSESMEDSSEDGREIDSDEVENRPASSASSRGQRPDAIMPVAALIVGLGLLLSW